MVERYLHCNNLSPASLGAALRVVRVSRRIPSRPSTRRTIWLSDDCEMPSLAAAFVRGGGVLPDPSRPACKAPNNMLLTSAAYAISLDGFGGLDTRCYFPIAL